MTNHDAENREFPTIIRYCVEKLELDWVAILLSFIYVSAMKSGFHTVIIGHKLS